MLQHVEMLWMDGFFLDLKCNRLTNTHKDTYTDDYSIDDKCK